MFSIEKPRDFFGACSRIPSGRALASRNDVVSTSRGEIFGPAARILRGGSRFASKYRVFCAKVLTSRARQDGPGGFSLIFVHFYDRQKG
jgi:hypothetical protein